MSKLLLVVITSTLMTITLKAEVGAEAVGNVTARQLVPWNLIEISYEMMEDRPGGRIMLNSGLYGYDPYEARTFIKEPTFEKGIHHVIWDAGADDVKVESYKAEVTVEVAGSVLPVLHGEYCIVDISKGHTATEYPVSHMEVRPAGGWPDKYKTEKIVLRKIDAGQCDGVEVPSCYVGVFELTQKQYQLIMGKESGWSVKGDTMPSMMSGWNSDGVSDVCVRLSAKTGLKFDCPTQTCLKYACLAGKKSLASFQVDLCVIGRFRENGGTQCAVGSYLPNVWGLYDTVGNAEEWCIVREGSPYAFGGSCYDKALSVSVSKTTFPNNAGLRLVASCE